MPAANIEINCEIEVPKIFGTIDSEKVQISKEEVEKFASGELGDHYLNILIPNDDIFSELHAKKSDMKKKGAIFEISVQDDGVKIKVKGIFKVNAYAHVLERMKVNFDKIYVAGLFCGDWPPYGGNFQGVEIDKNKFPIHGKIV